MEILQQGSVTSPAGYRAVGISAGLKRSGAKDLAIIFSERPCIYSGAFTENKMAAPPIDYCRRVWQSSEHVRAIVINSGNANACTGNAGLKDAEETAAHTAMQLGIAAAEVLVSSTGRIGYNLPMEKIRAGIDAAVQKLSPAGGLDAATAIMTTDRMSKYIAVKTLIDGAAVTIGGIAKGAGMLAPKMATPTAHATMLAYITTDAVLERSFLNACLEESLDLSFNRITVDGDVSTNDTVIVLANGIAGNSIIRSGSAGAGTFQEAYNYVVQELAKMMVMDGEGATKFVTVRVIGARSDQDARQGARAVSNSLLCKTAWFGQDPTWGRIAAAIGYAGIDVDPQRININYDGLPVVRSGVDAPTPRSERQEILKKRAFTVEIDLGIGNGSFDYWTSDLSYDYVKINAEYYT